ncbi:putative DNA-binding protein (MmcQ/YjbR family) [Streptomyces sp. V1I1]|nr:putative DNA-binding protein (MmcQ/YjbR family) [Streptomyces sp. V1I1]
MTDGSYPLGVGVKLKDEAMHAHVLSCPGAEPSGYGLGKAGWVQIPLAQKGAPSAAVLCDWVEESYRSIATKKLIAELEAR